MRSFSRALNKKKGKQNEKRKHSVPDSLTGVPSNGSPTPTVPTSNSTGSVAIPPTTPTHTTTNVLPPPILRTTSVQDQMSPAHHIVHVHSSTPPKKESPSNNSLIVTHDAWSNKSNGPLNSPSIILGMPKVSVGIIDDLQATARDREDMISITKDVQKFLAAISQLRQAVEEMDLHRPDTSVNILDSEREANEEDIDETDGGGGHFTIGGIESRERGLLQEGSGVEDNVVVQLKELISVVECCLGANPGMQSTELTKTSKKLLKTYQCCTHNDGKVSECNICNAAIDCLVDTFTQCVSDYMTGDSSVDSTGLQSGGVAMGGASLAAGKTRPQALLVPQNKMMSSSKSYDNLARFSSSVDLTQANEPIVDSIDQALSSIENSVEVASSYIKLRLKYHREIVSYVTKRAQIEQRYYTQLGKAVRQTQTALAELHQQDEFLPLHDVLRKSLEQDNRYAMNCDRTFNLQTGHKVLEPLEHKIQECEKMRKELINNWNKEKKKLNDTKTAMKSAKTKYNFLGQELSRAKNQLSSEPFGKQADRKKKEVTELEGKFQESELTYKTAIAQCNDCQYQVHATAQKSILCAFRRLIVGLDVTLKAGLENYYQLQHNFFQSLPQPLSEILEDTKVYEQGSHFLSLIQKLPQVSEELEDYHFEEFDPDEEIWDTSDESSAVEPGGGAGSDMTRHQRAVSPPWSDRPTIAMALPMIRTETPSPKPVRPKSVAILDLSFDTNNGTAVMHSGGGGKSNLQRRNSEKGSNFISSPYHSKPNPAPPTPSVEDIVFSKVARSHNFKKLRTPSRCRGCDTYVYFHGFECETCGLSCHRKCLSTLAIRCGNKKLPRKMTTFGVDFHEHLKATKRLIPIIVTKCINEIDERGLQTQGLYRISSAKSKMEKLCQLFEAGSERVDLSELPPHLISSCLKLYFRQLPEPLLTFSLYQEFLTFAREASPILPCNFNKAKPQTVERGRDVLNRLQRLISQLPESNQLTLARLMYHLHRVSSPENVKTNCMPPSNIGIVFGPNLLRQKEVLPSLELLADMSYQAKAVEIMAAHAHDIFQMNEEDLKNLESVEEEETPSNERLVGEDIIVKTTLDVDEDNKRLSESRTPFSTPPEQRKQNMEELHELAEEFTLGVPDHYHHTKSQANSTRSNVSPLLTDSRGWDKKGGVVGGASSLPGSVDDQGFAESIFNMVKKRLRPQNGSPEKGLTPLLEREASTDENDESVVFEKIGRRRTQSLTKDAPPQDNETDMLKGSYDNVFDTDNDPVRKLFASENNLLAAESRHVSNNTSSSKSFESGILRCVDGSDHTSLSSSIDSVEYKPFQSTHVQALLLPTGHSTSTQSNEVPARSLPRNFTRPLPPALPPMRQLSEGQIHVKPILKTSQYMVTSPPPLSSPLSFKSSVSVPSSSRGSFSEGYSEELGSHKDEYETPPTSTRNDNFNSSGAKFEESSKPASFRISGCSTDDDYPLDDIPLPDESPHPPSGGVVKSFKSILASSRDSGLSDSPDPFVEINSPSHAISSRVLVDKLTALNDKESTGGKLHPSPLVNTTTRPAQVKRQQTLPLKHNKPRITRHVMRVMKSLDLDDRTTPILSPPSNGNEEGVLPEERLRMISPDAIFSPSDEEGGVVGGDRNIKRSKSQAEGVNKNINNNEESEKRVRDLIISEAKIGRRISRISLGINKDISKSLEALTTTSTTTTTS